MIGLCLGELPLGYFVLSPVHHAGRGSLSSKPWNKAVDFSKLTKYCDSFRFLKFFVSIFAGRAQFSVKQVSCARRHNNGCRMCRKRAARKRQHRSRDERKSIPLEIFYSRVSFFEIFIFYWFFFLYPQSQYGPPEARVY